MRFATSSFMVGAGLVAASVAASFLGCSSSDTNGYDRVLPGNAGSTPTSGGGSSGDGAAATNTATTGGSTPTQTTGSISLNSGTTGEVPLDEGCAAVDTPTTLQEIVMAFVFDVSASMGNGQEPFYSRSLKWDPVVAATKAFFSDPNSTGLSATLTFFPNELAPIAEMGGGMMGGGNMGNMNAATTTTTTTTTMGLFQFPGGDGDAECDANGYVDPDVPLTALPSEAFAAAIDAVTPPDDNTWRLGTPTLAALEGTYTAIETMRAQNPNGAYTVILVTDGMPALCGGGDDDVATVADAARAVVDTIPTYVIGVENPVTDEEPNPPDSVSDLNEVAVAGGTTAAFLIDTSNPTQTASELKAVIEQIRESSFSCSISIPPPPGGQTFDQSKVNVQYTSSATGEVDYVNDPTCVAPNAWHYDNEAAPTTIEICPSACEQLRASPDGQLDIAFGCQTRIQ